MEYHFEEQQHLKLILYDIDDNYHIDELYKQDYMGEAEFYLADVFTSGTSLELPLVKEGTSYYMFLYTQYCYRSEKMSLT